MRKIVISDCERVELTAPIARAYGVGLEATTFYDTNYLDEHPDGIATYRAQTHEIPYMSMHGPFTGLSTGVRDRAIRDVTMRRYLESCDTAERLGIRDIVIHNNYYDYCAPKTVWLENTVSFFAELTQEISGRNICFHLENTLERDGELICQVLSRTDSAQLDLCLDVGHAQGMVPDGLPATEWVRRYGEWIGHVHLHNNSGHRDEHRNLNDGVIPMQELLALLEARSPNAVWCVECGLPWQDVTQSLKYLIKMGYLPRREGTA